MLTSFQSIEIRETFQQTDQSPTGVRDRPREFCDAVPEHARSWHHKASEAKGCPLVLLPEIERLLCDVDNSAGKRAGDFVPFGLSSNPKHCEVKLFGNTHVAVPPERTYQVRRKLLRRKNKVCLTTLVASVVAIPEKQYPKRRTVISDYLASL